VKAVGNLSEKNIDEASAILLSHDDGSYAVLESSLQIKYNRPAEIFGTEGVIRLLDPWFEKSPGIEVEMDNGKKDMVPFAWEGHVLQFEIEEVVRCVSQQKIESGLMPHVLSKMILEIMDEIRDQVGVSYPEYE
jgi:predicted dehydrogenase